MKYEVECSCCTLPYNKSEWGSGCQAPER